MAGILRSTTLAIDLPDRRSIGQPVGWRLEVARLATACSTYILVYRKRPLQVDWQKLMDGARSG